MQRGGLALFTDNLVLFCRFEHNFALSARRRNRAYQAARASWSRVSQPVESALIKRLLIAKPSIKSADEPTREISVSCGDFRESCVLIRIEIFVMESSGPWIGSFSFLGIFQRIITRKLLCEHACFTRVQNYIELRTSYLFVSETVSLATPFFDITFLTWFHMIYQSFQKFLKEVSP